MTRRYVKAVGAAAVLALALAACGSASGSGKAAGTSKPTVGGTLDIGQDTAPVTFDPQLASAFSSQNVLFQVYESLFAFNAKGERVPQLALNAKMVDPTTYDIALRKNVVFHDGQSFSAADVVYSFERMKSPAEGGSFAPYLGAVKTVSALSDDEVEFKLSAPDAGLLNKLVMPYFPIMSKSWTEQQTKAHVAATTNGTGPYELASYVNGQSVTLTRNPHYWNPPQPYISTLVMHIIGTEGTRLAALRSGQVQLAWFREPVEYKQVKKAGYQTAIDAKTRTLYMFVNTLEGPLSDVRVRQAISMGLDRQALIRAGSSGTGALSGVIPPGFQAGLSVDPADLPNYTYDPAKAKDLLAQAGHQELSITLTLASDPSFALDVPMAETMKSELADIGVDLKLVEEPFATVIKSVMSGKYSDLALLPGTQYPDASLYITTYLPQKVKRAKINDPQLASMVAAAAAEPNTTKRSQLYTGIQKYVADKAYLMIPYAMPQRFEAWTGKLHGYVTDPQAQRAFLKNAWLS